MKKQQIRNSLLLLLTSVIWGVAFVAQSVGMEYVGPFTFNCVRSLIGGIVLIPCIALLRRINPPRQAEKPAPTDGKNNAERTRRADGENSAGQARRTDEKNGTGRAQVKTGAGHSGAAAWIRGKKDLLLGGVCCGTALAVASSLQQFGIAYTTVGKAGFITAFYIVIVPVLGIFLGKRCGLSVWIGVALALAGLYFLCITDGLTVARGDIFVLLCAFVFSVHILVIDHFSPLTDGVTLSCLQFFVCGILCSVPMLLFEHPQIGQILAAWKPILYAGALSCGVGYTLQVVGQKNMDPTVASLILSLESVMSVLAGMVILGQRLSLRESVGCVLMFAAILLAELGQGKKA